MAEVLYSGDRYYGAYLRELPGTILSFANHVTIQTQSLTQHSYGTTMLIEQ